MPTCNVVLTEQQAPMIERLVRSGPRQNADGMPRVVGPWEAEDKARLVTLRKAVSVGLEDFVAGRFRSFADGDALRLHLTARSDKMMKSSPG